MKLEHIKPGNNIPEDINVVIEIPANALPIKYEVDKESQAVWVDRFMATPMFYPANYGFIPNTLGDDGDPLDVLVVTPYPLIPGAVINARPLGVLIMSDDGGIDSKIVAVPTEKLTSIYDDIKDINDLPQLLTLQIEHFFENYKDLEKGKWVKIENWEGSERAKEIINSSLK